MIRLAIQSKGRLNEDSTALLREIGIDIDDSRRKFLSQAPNFPLELLYMRDDDIPGVVSSGTAALGIVGLNEVEEHGLPVQIVKKLGFGACRISLAVPKTVDYTGPKWFAGKRIATSYPRILKKWLDEQGIEARIEVITGSVEIAPAADIADAIFDIVSSGGTLVSNGLVEVEKVFWSEAVLISSGDLTPDQQEILDEMLFRIDSAMVSRRKKYILMNLPQASVEEATRILPAMRSPTVMPLAAEGWCSMHSVVDEDDLWDKIKQLKAIGAEGILVLNIDKLIP
ncbi:MAG: ATP phosphoribosyltransferase [Bacteroidales bacterium]|jgi:ATP phosphoribosyltransferase|nr:ATP phosphoribosyltransferase [Bacteroidales bacterium]MBO7574499.1 ATP phosphoribosyltransferase [Bacteroidales bacterium]MDY6418480.1 ATP phosphoribosyltransferase [Bacteroidales bacterium]